MTSEIPFAVPPLSWRGIDNTGLEYLEEHMPEVLERPSKTDVLRLIEVKMGKSHGIYVVYDEDLRYPIEAELDPLTKIVHLNLKTLADLESGLPRPRFTLAHEGGHVVLHMNFIRENQLKLARQGRTVAPSYAQPEPQANQAAASFIMPRLTFVPEYKRVWAKETEEWVALASLQNTFGVSEDAVTYRIKWLRKEGFI